MLGELIDLVSGIGMAEEADRSRDILGRVYEYFLGGFAGAEGKRGGEFYTPRSVVRLLVEMLEPYKGRVYDPCCGSGGMFVQSEKFVEEHGGRTGDIAIYGQDARPALNKVMLGELIDLVSGIGMAEEADRSRDILGRVYEYFLGGFAGAEGKRGGEFYTPRSVVRLLVEMLEPYKGRVYDPCCGSGGMFVQSEKFVEEHGGRTGDIAIYGQESNYTTWRLAKMNLAVRGIDADIRWNNEGSFHKDELPDLKADFILANPPFNISDWGGDRLREDARWKFGVPPVGNANYAWLEHIHHHLAPNGVAGVVLANGSMSSGQSGERDIRRSMVEGDVVDCMITLPGQLFYSTQIPACLWFLARNKNPGRGWRDRRRGVLFIDARKLGHMVDRTRKAFSDEDIAKIAGTYHSWRGALDMDAYADELGFCKAATLEEIGDHNHILTPGRYVGMAVPDAEAMPFEERFAELKVVLAKQFAEAEKLTAVIQAKLEGISRHD